jgi:hypothetical protein
VPLVLSVLAGGCDPETLTAIGTDDAGDSPDAAVSQTGDGGPIGGGHDGAVDSGGIPKDQGVVTKLGCKRGVAANVAPGAAFHPAIGWWYNWALQGTGPNVGIEFVPMVWGSGSVGMAIPSGSKYLLGFNEPSFHAQSNLTPQQAAGLWPMIKTQAAGAQLVSPAMSYCGPAANCNGTDPYQYLKDFLAACPGCEVDHVAVHWYNCDLPSLKDYIETGNNLPGWEQFNKPIWLTEFSCDGNATVADQEAYMRAAIPYLENNPKIYRYSWFSAGPIPNAKLVNDDGSPTALGQVYINLPQTCP